jgi:glyoxylase-like metal-dependent hydrolase (beta-lactamase superfamily II)
MVDTDRVTNVTADAEGFTSNAWLVEGDRTVLVDAGAWSGVVDAVRREADGVDDVVLTHQHGDHVGALDAVLDAFDAGLECYGDHPRATRRIADGDEIRLGDTSYEAVHTPGHADDHVALVGDEAVFSGDVVVYEDGAFSGGSFGRTDMAGQDREVLIESIRELLDRLPADVEALYAGHGPAFEGDVRSVVERALERAERREPKYE